MNIVATHTLRDEEEKEGSVKLECSSSSRLLEEGGETAPHTAKSKETGKRIPSIRMSEIEHGVGKAMRTENAKRV